MGGLAVRFPWLVRRVTGNPCPTCTSRCPRSRQTLGPLHQRPPQRAGERAAHHGRQTCQPGPTDSHQLWPHYLSLPPSFIVNLFCKNHQSLINGIIQKGFGIYWGLTPQQQPGSYQGGEMMMMKSVFWWRKPEYPEETTKRSPSYNTFYRHEEGQITWTLPPVR